MLLIIRNKKRVTEPGNYGVFFTGTTMEVSDQLHDICASRKINTGDELIKFLQEKSHMAAQDLGWTQNKVNEANERLSNRLEQLYG